jgi:hypothetical protein
LPASAPINEVMFAVTRLPLPAFLSLKLAAVPSARTSPTMRSSATETVAAVLPS